MKTIYSVAVYILKFSAKPEAVVGFQVPLQTSAPKKVRVGLYLEGYMFID